MSFDSGIHNGSANPARGGEKNEGIFSQIAMSIRRVSVIFTSVLAGNMTPSVRPAPMEKETSIQGAADSVLSEGTGGGGETAERVKD